MGGSNRGAEGVRREAEGAAVWCGMNVRRNERGWRWWGRKLVVGQYEARFHRQVIFVLYNVRFYCHRL